MSILEAIPFIGNIFAKRAESKHAEIMVDAQLAEKKQQAIAEDEKRSDELQQEEAKGANAYDVAVVENQKFTWKDEYALLIVTAPFVMGFIPFLAPFVAEGWKALTLAPSWYSWIFMGSLSTALGMRWLWKMKN